MMFSSDNLVAYTLPPTEASNINGLTPRRGYENIHSMLPTPPLTLFKQSLEEEIYVLPRKGSDNSEAEKKMRHVSIIEELANGGGQTGSSNGRRSFQQGKEEQGQEEEEYEQEEKYEE